MNFFNLSRSSAYTDFTEIGVDMHSHLLPGVDDGARDVLDSLSLIEGLRELGFLHLFTTPHTFNDLYPNTRDSLLSAFDGLRSEISSGISLGVSSEYYIDEQFLVQLRNETLLPLPGKRILLEFSMISMPLVLEQIIDHVISAGYQPVMAHPERYSYFSRKFEFLSELKEIGVEFQVNALSLVGHYGSSVKAFAEELIDQEFIDFLGTDLHNRRQLEVLKTVPRAKYFQRLVDSQRLKNQLLMAEVPS